MEFARGKNKDKACTCHWVQAFLVTAHGMVNLRPSYNSIKTSYNSIEM